MVERLFSSAGSHARVIDMQMAAVFLLQVRVNTFG